MYRKIRRRDGIESLTNLAEVQFKVTIDGCIRVDKNMLFTILLMTIGPSIGLYVKIWPMSHAC